MENQNAYNYVEVTDKQIIKDHSYQRLMEETLLQVQFLNQVPANVVEQSVEVFRENIFSYSGRRQIPHKIYEILEQELI
jgi:hypothetical protein